MKLVKVSCAYCGHANKINLDDYHNAKEFIGLFDKCEFCHDVYGFDVEQNYLTCSYKV